MSHSIERPTFPIGFQWIFSPHSEIWKTDLLNEPNIVDFVCLPVEASLLYGGPVSDLLDQVSKSFQTTLSAGWPSFPPQAEWDPIYRDSLSLLCERIDPGTIYLENYRPKLTELVGFEVEMKKISDASPVLNIPLQWHGDELLWDELWVSELIRKTRLQVCLRLDSAFSNVAPEKLMARKEKIFRLLSVFKEHPLRLSEIRLPVTEKSQSTWEAELETWKEICFDEANASAIVFVWNEPQATSEQLKNCLKTAHAYRAGVDAVTRGNHTSQIETSSWEIVFESVFPRLVQAVGWDNLKGTVQKFLGTLDQGEWDPHETLRRWPIFLKVTGDPAKVSWIDLSMFDWAQFSAQFHPAEENDEQLGLKAQEIKANPTIQIVRQKENISAIYRARQSRGNLVQSRELAWYEAAILDELQEAPRLELTALVNHLINVPSPQNLKLDRATWLKHIAEMAKSGLILYSQVE